jgi:hypothetical protein
MVVSKNPALSRDTAMRLRTGQSKRHGLAVPQMGQLIAGIFFFLDAA